ncbi:MAG: type I restriction enzyme HsdR N-terminal domain-containing protein [Bacteroidales bacterium]|nr:type I restriction enzyme HsdR N-terminal domain-containing protein [Bacteroidales bacterium]
MENLNFPVYDFRYTERENKKYIFDIIRKKYVLLTPEEWVRQNFIRYLLEEKGYIQSLVQVEMFFKLNRLSKRADIALFDRNGKPKILVECKSPKVAISQVVFEQVARYNLSFKVDFLVVTNGMQHFCCKMDYEKKSYTFLKEIPDFEEMG